MKLTRILTLLAIAVSALTSALQALADYSADGFIVRVGASYVDPDEDASSFSFDGLPAADFLGSELNIDEDWGWNISAVWLPVEHWGVELMYTGSVNHDVDLHRFGGLLPLADRMRLGSFDASMSDMFLNWYPMGSTCLGQPYVGLGVNYTDFHDDSLSQIASDYLIGSGLAIDNGSLGMGHSWGLDAQIGIDFMFGRDSQWLGNAAIIYRDVDVDPITISFPNQEGYNRLISDFDYDPWALNLGIGYKF
jgi:outer membrane protein